MCADSKDRWTWDDPPRRDVDWVLLYSDTRGEFEIQACDSQDFLEFSRSSYFRDDDEAALFVINTATNGLCPREDVQDECRAAIVELTTWWDDDEF